MRLQVFWKKESTHPIAHFGAFLLGIQDLLSQLLPFRRVIQGEGDQEEFGED